MEKKFYFGISLQLDNSPRAAEQLLYRESNDNGAKLTLCLLLNIESLFGESYNEVEPNRQATANNAIIGCSVLISFAQDPSW
jgi:hypothetical protein